MHSPISFRDRAGIVIGDLAQRSPDSRARPTRSTRSGLWIRSSTTRRVLPRTRECVRRRKVTPDMAVNVLAPYLLPGLMQRPAPLVYLSSGHAFGGRAAARHRLDRAQWDTNRGVFGGANSSHSAAFAVHASGQSDEQAVDPGWYPTRMGGETAPDNSSRGSHPRPGLRPATIQRRKSAETTGITASSGPRPNRHRTHASRMS